MDASHYLDVGDLDDLQARLSLGSDAEAQRTVFVLGSGLSNGVVPDVATAVSIFQSYLPQQAQAKLDEQLVKNDPTQAYQNAASLLKRQGGDARVARAIRELTLHACRDVPPTSRREIAGNLEACRRLEEVGNWVVPRGYRMLARHLASGLAGPRPAIITTNFDPLIDLALRLEGHVVNTVPIPADTAPSPEQVAANPGIPVLHVHGHWLSTRTLNTVTQLTRPRPLLTGLLREQLRGSLVVVVGYSGWPDAFMLSLRERIREMDLLGSEILWAAYNESPETTLANETLGSLYGMPNFTLYCGIDGNRLFDAVGGQPFISNNASEAKREVAPYGYTQISTTNGDWPAQTDPTRFLNGSQPSWADAQPGAWPTLSATEQLWSDLKRSIEGDGGRGVVAIGPTGEGKSLALRQLALRAANEYPDLRVLWRDPGAPPISAEWLDAVSPGDEAVLICADDADLIASSLQQTRDRWEARTGITWLLASQDRLWWRHGRTLSPVISETVFHGLTRTDALAIAATWEAIDSKEAANVPLERIEATADRLLASAQRVSESTDSTLFGAVLDVRYGAGLIDRISDLVSVLDNIKVRPEADVTLGDVYGVICLMQDALDPDGRQGLGANRSILAATVGLEGVFADGKILRDLGREAAITYAGDQVYSRHPSIAKAVVKLQRDSGKIIKVAGLAGLAGGRLRVSGSADGGHRAYRGAYMLGTSLGTAEEAVAAAEGAVKGARGLLEPYVTLLSVRRKFRQPRAIVDAQKLVNSLSAFTDYGSAGRVFLVEFSSITRSAGQPQAAVGLASLALSDGVGYQLDARRASYALTSLTGAARSLREQNPGAASVVPELCAAINTKLGSQYPEVTASSMGGLRKDILETVSTYEPAHLVQQLRLAVQPAATAVTREYSLVETVGEALSFGDLTRLLLPGRRG